MNTEQLAQKIAQDMKMLQNNMPALIDAARLQARLTRVRYLALVAEGFTETQALQLCFPAQSVF